MNNDQLHDFIRRITSSEELTQRARKALDGASDAKGFCALAEQSGYALQPEVVAQSLREELAASMSCLASGAVDSSPVLRMLQRLELDAPPAWLRMPSVQFDTGSLCW